MINYGLKIHFDGISEDEFYGREDSRVSVLSGMNNCGKTLLLKLLFTHFGKKAYLCGTHRYSVVDLFPMYTEQANFIDNNWKNTRENIVEAKTNLDPIVLSFQDVFIRMGDDERLEVCRICSNCLGEKVALEFAEPGNSLSQQYLKIDDTPLVKCSSGSRMLVHLVTVLISKLFDVVLIDEPELGLTPRIQNTLSQMIFDTESEAFPHLSYIYIATHSHIFLNHRRITDNFLIQKTGSEIHVKRLSTHREFRDLQFTQLGNSLEQLQLPSGFLIVEGKTDCNFLNRLLYLKFPQHRVKVISANGDGQLKKKLYDLLEVIGQLETSPYSDRVLVMLDVTHSSTLVSDFGKRGFRESNVFKWSKNGIEYYYPVSILRDVFEDDSLNIADLQIELDRVSHDNGIEMTKEKLSEAVLVQMNGSEELDSELEQVLERIEQFG